MPYIHDLAPPFVRAFAVTKTAYTLEIVRRSKNATLFERIFSEGDV
jgi:hypothetical protein